MLKLYSLILQAYENVKNKTGEKPVEKTEGQDITGLEFSVSVAMLEREDSDINELILSLLNLKGNITLNGHKDKKEKSMQIKRAKELVP